MNNNENQKTWQKVLGILFLIFIMPIGIVFMWCTRIFSKKTRIIVSCVCAPILFLQLLMFIGIMASSSTPTNTKIDTSTQVNNEENSNDKKVEQNNDASKEAIESSEKTDEKQEANIEKKESQIKAEDKTVDKAEEVSFNDLKRNPDKYVGKKIVVNGYINQVLEGNDDMPTNLKIYDDKTNLELILLYNRKTGEQRFLEGDYISSIAMFQGIQGLDMLDGSNQAFPVAVVETIKANEAVQSVQ
ncbi:hypothetical protein [Clostridium butyricum]